MKSAFDSVKAGLLEALEHVSGGGGIVRVHKPKWVDVKSVRQKTGMTQAEFAAVFGFGLGTLRHWEQGDRRPRGPSLVLLNVIAKDPKSVLMALERDRPA